MVIESVRGAGEGLVSGGLKPQRIELYRGADWHTASIDHQIAETALKIEALFGSPQDIEWVVRRGVIYIVQSRPITTITKEQIALAEYLDESMPTTPFYFAKTGVAEIVPRPSVWALETLKTIYAQGGPVNRVYQKHGMNYFATEQFVLVGGQLYIDKEAELRSLLPAFSYFGSGTLTPKVTGFAGLIATWRNLRKIQSMKHDVERLEAEMKEALGRDGDLVSDYELVFEIGLAAEGALKRLEGMRGKIEMTDLLSAQVGVEDLEVDPPAGAIGNSLDVADTEPFVALQRSEVNREVTLPPSLERPVQELQRLVRLREYARWLVVKRVNEIRASVSLAKLARSEPQFSIACPTVLTNHGKTADRKTIGVSAGVAEGTLATEESISETSGSVILVVKQLSPSLVQYFGRVAGVVSENGGLLSHFAILAREQGLPVVVGADLTDQNGEQVRINGTTGEIQTL
jgi:phosphohistidine swiveling domain-containing protein